MKTKFTKGPYIAVTFFNEIAIQQVKTLLAGDRPEIATLSLKSVVISEEEQLANAHLVAAAPEMYEALVEIRKLVGKIEGKGTTQSFEIAEIIANVLAKARGES